mmetsp:Transcript_19313/g.58541  ORF Transcript_19313/g.58541 Transcript_19313/m.58541 type:complete len:142 (-) Transcript_19313:7-432(-)
MHRGQFYIVGGLIHADGFPATGAVHVCDTTADRQTASWTRACELPSPRADHVLVVHQDRLFCIGGRCHGDGPIGSECPNLCLSEDGSEWCEIPPLPRPDPNQPAADLDDHLTRLRVASPRARWPRQSRSDELSRVVRRITF